MNTSRVALVGVLWFVLANTLLGQVNGFLKDFEPKNATLPPYQEKEKPSAAATLTIAVDVGDTLGKVSKYLYGNNANVWMGQMVTEPKLINYIRSLSPHILRFPGGNLSSVFFWSAAVNQPPRDVPDSLFDSNGGKVPAAYWHGNDTASWTLSVDNYYRMLEMTGSTGIITVNYSYARYGTGPNPAAQAAHLAADWVRYDNGRTKFWEIGNENAGSWQAGYQIDTALNKDRQPRIITGELYGIHFNVFADSMRKAANEIRSTIYIGAQLIQYDASSAAEPDRSWNSGFFGRAGNAADFFIVHDYYTNYNENTNATAVLFSATTETDVMMANVQKSVSRAQVQMKPIALTEWNIFAVGSKQMCSFINGMHAAIALGELARTGFSMASRWDLANGYDNGNDHGMFSIGDEPGVPKWNPRPAFFYMYYFQRMFGDHSVNTSATGPRTSVLAFASTFLSKHLGIVVANKGTADQVVRLDLGNYAVGDRFYVYSLRGGTDNGEFSQSVYVNDNAPTNSTGGPINALESLAAWAYPTGNEIKFTSPAKSVQYLLIEPGNQVVAVDNDRNAQKTQSSTHRIAIYPSPSNGAFRIDLPGGGYVQMDIFDLLGRKIYSKAINPLQTVLQLQPNLASGHYFVRLYSGKDVRVVKLIISK